MERDAVDVKAEWRPEFSNFLAAHCRLLELTAYDLLTIVTRVVRL